MKKFVSMTDINSVFSTVNAVDYVTVKSVTDTSVDLTVYLKLRKLPKKDSDLYSRLNDCNVVLGKMLSRKVSYSLVPASFFGKFTDLLANLFIKCR